MEAVKNLRIVQNIFEERLPNEKFDIVELFLFSRPKNRKIFYIGKNRNNETTLFKHSKEDKVYYDVLHQNKMYSKLEIRKVDDLDSLVKIKKKERRNSNDN